MLDVSDTAYAIAAIRADEHAREEPFFVDPLAARFFAAAGASAREGTARFRSLPFFDDGIRIRTRAIDDVVRAAVAEGATQLVLLGAGFDTRAFRMPELARAGATAFEVDFAALLEKKAEILGDVACPIPIRSVGCDFLDPAFAPRLLADLEGRGFRRDVATVFVWEGVVAYVDGTAVDRTLAFVARACSAPTTLVFDYGSPLYSTAEAGARAREAGFLRFEELSYDELWTRFTGAEPHPAAAYCKLGIART